jgi:aspartate kinase
MRSHSGVAAKMFDLLGKAGINIQMITTSEIKISVIVDEVSVDEGANIVHAGFGLGRTT